MKTYPGRREFDTRSTLPHTADLWLTRLSSIIMNLELKLFKYDNTLKVNVSC